MMSTVLRFTSLLLIVFALAACSSLFKEKEDDSQYMTAEELFVDGRKALAEEQYKLAIRRFEALQAMYPFSDYAEQAQLELVYAYFENKDYPLVNAAAERYIRLYPHSDRIDYAYYMKGLANFNQERGLFARLFSVDVSLRDPGTQAEAYQDFNRLVRQFPDSEYTADAIQRMVYLRNLYAQRELQVAEFYMERRNFVAAANRARYLLENYQQAPQAEHALVILVKANRELGLEESANDALETLRLTYPDSPQLKRLT